MNKKNVHQKHIKINLLKLKMKGLSQGPFQDKGSSGQIYNCKHFAIALE